MGDGGAKKEARRARMDEEARQARISEGTSRVRKQFGDTFNEPYYAEMAKNMRALYQPGVNEQHEKMYQQLQAALMRAGLGESSVAAQKEKESTKALGDANTAVDQRILQATNQRKLDLEGSANTVIGQLTNTGDATAAYNQAAAAIGRETSPQAIPPLGQIFQDFTAGLSTQAELERQGQARYNMFGRIPGWGSPNRYTTNVRG